MKYQDIFRDGKERAYLNLRVPLTRRQIEIARIMANDPDYSNGDGDWHGKLSSIAHLEVEGEIQIYAQDHDMECD